ncbi:hypothetical protein FACS189450_11680 [Spirochaetia bacterium]|nr:hypothetical protein FACS189450_11680 [Spirochaetia bacterium]
MRKNVLLMLTGLALVLAFSLALGGCPVDNGTSSGTTYTVTFDTQGGSTIEPRTVSAGSKVTLPVDPTRAGFVFDNWYDAATDGAVVSWPLTVNRNIRVYAYWIEPDPFSQKALDTAGEITLTVPKTGGGTAAVGITVSSDTGTVTITIDGEPKTYETGEYVITEDAIILKGIGEDGTNVAIGYEINEEHTLTITGGLDKLPGAGLTGGSVISDIIPGLTPPVIYTVTFDTQDGSTVPSQTVNAGLQVSKPGDPTRTGYVFDNWYDAATGGSVVSWPLTVNRDITVYARWDAEGETIIHYTVTFDTQGGSTIAAQTVNAGSAVTQPGDPIKPGFDFDNWYTAVTGGTVVSWPLTVNRNTTVYARWDTVVSPVYGISLDQTGTHTFPVAAPGYAAQTPKTVTITNSGDQATGALTIALSGTGSGSFTLSSSSVSSIAVSGNGSFTVVPKTGLVVGTYTATVTVSGGNGITANFAVSFMVSSASIYGISLDQTETHTFAAATIPYAAPTAKSVTITNTGNQATGNLTIALSGTGSGSFTLSSSSVSSIAAGGNSSFTVVPKPGLAAGTYSDTVTVSGDNITAKSFDVSFTVNSPASPPTDAATPSITGQPASSATYSLNATATPLTVTATIADSGSGGTLSYQWYKNTSNSTTGGTSLGSANGAQTASYTPVTSATGALYYYVVVTNTNNSVSGTKTATATSSVATVTVNTLVNAAIPSITGQPASSAAYTQNATATPLTVTATVTDSGTLSYQWYRNTSNSTTGGTVIASATSASYTPVTSATGALYYYVVVTNTNTSASGTKTATATSSVATVTVNALVNAATPSITGQPASSATYSLNATATPLTVTATIADSGSGGTLSYQWYRNTSNSTTGGTVIASATSASYTPVTSATGTLYYYVVVTNTNNSVSGTKTVTATSSVATITVNALVNAAAPSITGQPASSATYSQNATATALTVTATVTDSGTLSYQWYRNTSNSTTGGTVIASATSASYIPVTSATGALYYYVVVTNTNNSVSGTKTATTTSSVATVTVNALVNAATPSITGQPASSATYLQNATAAALTVTATVTDSGTLSYQWYRNTSNSTTGGTLVGTNSASYTPVTSAAGILYYYVVVTNTNTSVNGTTTATATSSVATVTVNAPTYGINLDQTTTHTFTAATFGYGAQPNKTVTITNTGNQATGALTVALDGANPGSFTLSSGSVSSIAAGGNTTFTVVPNPALGAGTYAATVTVSGDANITAKTFNVSFTVNPQSITAASVGGLVKPVTGATPVAATSLSVVGTGYTVQSIDWAPTGTFTAAASYTATIVLKAGADYTFTGAITPAVNVGTPALGSITGTGAANTLSFEVNYPATTGTKGITINAFVNEDGTLMTSGGSSTIDRSDGDTLTLTAAAGLTVIQWSLDGVGISTAQSITFRAIDYPAGKYNLDLVVRKGGIPYSTSLTITVEN